MTGSGHKYVVDTATSTVNTSLMMNCPSLGNVGHHLGNSAPPTSGA